MASANAVLQRELGGVKTQNDILRDDRFKVVALAGDDVVEASSLAAGAIGLVAGTATVSGYCDAPAPRRSMPVMASVK